MMDKHYRALLSLPIPMLGNVSPHEARRTAAGRKKLVAWLKLLEDGRQPQGRRQSAWRLRFRLDVGRAGVEDLRK